MFEVAMTENGKILGIHASRTPREAKRPRPVKEEPVALELPRWINVSGLECGADRADFCNDFRGEVGQDYFLNQRPAVSLLADAGFVCFRIPFRWELLQP